MAQHVLVLHEAQRSFDAGRLKDLHSDLPGFTPGKSEPAHFIEFSERILGGAPADQNRDIAASLASQGYLLRITHELETARGY